MRITQPLVVVSCDTEVERDDLIILFDRIGVSYAKFERTEEDRSGNEKTVYCLDVWIR